MWERANFFVTRFRLLSVVVLMQGSLQLHSLLGSFSRVWRQAVVA